MLFLFGPEEREQIPDEVLLMQFVAKHMILTYKFLLAKRATICFPARYKIGYPFNSVKNSKMLTL